MTANFGEWTWCHCRVALLGANVTCNCREPVALYTAMASRKNIQKNCLELLADVTLHKDWFLLSGVYAGIIFSPDSDSYRGSYFQYGGKATNHFGGLDVAPGCHCRVRGRGARGAIAGCHCRVPL